MDQRRIALLSWIVITTLSFMTIALNKEKPQWQNVDELIQNYLYDFLGSMGDFVFVVITYTGSAYVSYPITGIIISVFLYKRRHWTALLFVFNFLGVRLLNALLKAIFKRPRPELEHLVQVSSDSFPSGHAMNSIAFFGFMVYLLHRSLNNSGKSFRLVWLGAAILIGLIGLSRIYLGVHYPSDVVAGLLAGGAWLLASIFLYAYVPKIERL